MEKFISGRGIGNMKNKIFIPEGFRRNILKILNHGHQGITRTIQNARQYVYWNGITKCVEDMCVIHKINYLKPNNNQKHGALRILCRDLDGTCSLIYHNNNNNSTNKAGSRYFFLFTIVFKKRRLILLFLVFLALNQTVKRKNN